MVKWNRFYLTIDVTIRVWRKNFDLWVVREPKYKEKGVFWDWGVRAYTLKERREFSVNPYFQLYWYADDNAERVERE